mmetsp:Transcript_39756/g.119516  ORF Transcript_39756/g.119516 Transcript_39756/m.119516 type:complete len:385 (-) Transcript_39756:34-1188(-)
MPSLIAMGPPSQSIAEEVGRAPLRGYDSCKTSRQSPQPVIPAPARSSLKHRTEEARRQLEVMLLRERSPDLRPRDYLGLVSSSHSSTTSSSRAKGTVIDRSCRTKMVRWMYDVVDYCEFDRESAYVASSHLDRFLSSSPDNAAAQRAAGDKRAYQLAAISCLYLAIKTIEPRTVLSPASMSNLSDGEYGEDEIVEMEGEILRALGWRVHGPTAAEFASYMLAIWEGEDDDNRRRRRKRARGTGEQLGDLIRYQVEISTLEYKSSLCRPSVVATAAICNALEFEHGRSAEAESFLRCVACCAEGESSESTSLVNILRERLVKMLRKTLQFSGRRSLSVVTPKVSCTEASDDTKQKSNRSSKGTLSPVCVTNDVNQRREVVYQRHR